jgi:hypothetical protein
VDESGSATDRHATRATQPTIHQPATHPRKGTQGCVPCLWAVRRGPVVQVVQFEVGEAGEALQGSEGQALSPNRRSNRNAQERQAKERGGYRRLWCTTALVGWCSNGLDHWQGAAVAASQAGTAASARARSRRMAAALKQNEQL